MLQDNEAGAVVCPQPEHSAKFARLTSLEREDDAQFETTWKELRNALDDTAAAVCCWAPRVADLAGRRAARISRWRTELRSFID